MSSLAFASIQNASARDINAHELHAPNSNWKGSDVRDGRFPGADLSNAVWDGVKTNYAMDLSGANTIGMSIRGATFEEKDGTVRGLRYNDLQSMGAVVAATDLAQERTAGLGFDRMVSHDTTPVLDKPMLTSLGGGERFEVSHVDMADSGNLKVPATPEGSGPKGPAKGGSGIA